MSCRHLAPLLLALAPLSLSACDGDGETDAGMADAGVATDAGAPLACEQPLELQGTLEGDGRVEVDFDTTMTMVRPQDLGRECGNTNAEVRWAPQQVVAYQVPGDGPVSVEFNTVNPGTTEEMVVFVQARVNDCGAIPSGRFPPFCFGPVQPNTMMPDEGEWRSSGQLQANGGDTIFFFVTGFSSPSIMGLVDRGTVRFQVTALENEPPTMSRALLVLDETDLRVEASGNDPNANARGVLLNFFDASGDMLDLYGDGEATLEDSNFLVRFDDPVSTGFDWNGGAWIRSVPMDDMTQLGEFLVAQNVTQALVRPFDAPNGIGEGMMVPLQEATVVGFNEACDEVTLCRAELECDATEMTCQPTAIVADACNNAQDVVLSTIENEAVTVTVMNNPRGMQSRFSPADGCVPPGAAAGGESVYAFDTPPSLTFDLIVDADTAGTGATNTAVYVRNGLCFDQAAEIGCNDDASPGNTASTLELMDLTGGSYFIYAEDLVAMMPPGSGAHELEITVRPVLDTGATCDPDELLNRCAVGPCNEGICP
jgi:hypothetical protein